MSLLLYQQTRLRKSLSLTIYVCFLTENSPAIRKKLFCRSYQRSASHPRSMKEAYNSAAPQKKKKKNLISVCLAWLKNNQNSSPQLLHENHALECLEKRRPVRKKITPKPVISLFSSDWGSEGCGWRRHFGCSGEELRSNGHSAPMDESSHGHRKTVWA